MNESQFGTLKTINLTKFISWSRRNSKAWVRYAFLTWRLCSTQISHNVWNTINLDCALSWQQPKTSFKDERFISFYTQITSFISNGLSSGNGGKSQIRTPLGGFFYWTYWSESWCILTFVSSFAMMCWKKGYGARSQFFKIQNSLLPCSGFFKVLELPRISKLMARADAIQLVGASNPGRSMIITYFWWPFRMLWRRCESNGHWSEITLTLKNFELKYGKKLIVMIRKHYKAAKIFGKKYMSFGKNEWSVDRDHASVDYKSKCVLAFGFTYQNSRCGTSKIDLRYRKHEDNWQITCLSFFKVIFFRSFGQKRKKEGG